jgi:hypothetical protein
MNARLTLRCLITSITIVFVMALNTSAVAAEKPAPHRRLRYNFDGDSCLFTKAGGKGPVAITVDDVKRLINEVAFEGSQVDTVLVCINAQVTYYPSRVGTMRGALSTPAERDKWPPSEKQRFENLKRFFDAGVDPYAIMLAEAKRRGREALLTFRMNDAHGNNFLRTQFWVDHPEWRLGGGALDFSHDEVRDYVFRLIEEAVGRYDCDGIELDFNRFPTFFKGGTIDERVAKMNSLVGRVRKMLDEIGGKRGRKLVLAVRVPSNYGRTPPSPASSREIGCDPPVWARNGWVDFVTVSEFLHERYDLPIKRWKEAIRKVPVYGGIECSEGGSKDKYLTSGKYRRAARIRWQEGADGIYLFNFFTTREYGAESWEPPFEVLRELGDRAAIRVDSEGIQPKPQITRPGTCWKCFFGGEAWLCQARSDKAWAFVRVDSNELPVAGWPIKTGEDEKTHVEVVRWHLPPQ